MSTAIRRALTVLFFLAAVSGWALYANLQLNVAPAAADTNTNLETLVSGYLRAEVQAESGRGTFETAQGNLTGGALADAKAIAATNPGAISDMDVDGTIKTTTIWRQGDRSLIEARFGLVARGHHEQVAYHMFLRDDNGAWKIEMIWKLQIDPKTPLVPDAVSSFAVPGASSAPTK